MHRTFLILAGSLCLSTLFGQDISFYREDITMKIEEGFFYVQGTYSFNTTAAKTTHFLYPFPTGPNYGEIDSIAIYNLTEATRIEPLKSTPGATLFRLILKKNQTTEIQVFYRQELLGNQAEYILESTRGWGKPLEKANYQLLVPLDLHVAAFSILPQDSTISGDNKIYYWQKFNFMPVCDLVVSFQKK